MTESDDMWERFQEAFGFGKQPPAPSTEHDESPADQLEPPTDHSAPEQSLLAAFGLTEESQAPATDRDDTPPPAPRLPSVSDDPLAGFAEPVPAAPSPSLWGRAAAPSGDSADIASLLVRRPETVRVGDRVRLGLRLETTAAVARFAGHVRSDSLPQTADFGGESPGVGLYEIDSVPLLPQHAGTEEVRFVVDLFDHADRPIGRLKGSLMLEVERENAGSMTAGGDIMIVGGQAPNVGSGLFPKGSDWDRIDLLPDPLFAARLSRQTVPTPETTPDAFAIGRSTSRDSSAGALYLMTESDETLCVVCRFGSHAIIGREGSESADWGLSSSHQASDAISRQHATLEIRDDRAWVTDHSANGTALNGEPILRDQSTMLCDGDRIDLADCLPMIVRLSCVDGAVVAVCLERDDELRAEMKMLLALPGMPAMLTRDDSPLWLASDRDYQRNADGICLFSADDKRYRLIDGEEASLPTKTVYWYAIEGPIDQSQLFE